MNKESVKRRKMLRRISLIIAGLLVVGSMQAQGVCTINGTVRKDSLRFTPKRMDKVYLSKMDEYERIIAVDSVMLRDGKFSFSYPVDKDAPVLLYFITGFDNGQVPVFVEPGTVEIHIKEAAFPGGAEVRGTVTNELYAEYEKIGQRCVQAQSDSVKYLLKTKGNEWIDSPEGIGERNRIGASELLECIADRIQFLIKHNDSPLAALMMEREVAYMLDKRYAERLLKSLSPKLRNHPYYKSFYNSVRAQDLRVGGDLPDIRIPLLNGETASLSDYRGKFVLLDFWASWCAPCLKEIPNLIALYNEAKEKNADFVIVSFSLDNKEKAWKDAIKSKGIDLPGWVHGSDLFGWGSPAARLMGVTAIPKIILIDPEGKAISFSLRGEELTTRVRQILNGDLYYKNEQ